VANKKPFLRLVHSSTLTKKKTNVSADAFQIDLFSNIKSENSVVFVHPDDSNYDDLVGYIDSVNVQNIIDIREVPYLSFVGRNREVFFSFLRNRKISYLSTFSEMFAGHFDYMSDLFRDMSADNNTPSRKLLVDKLRDAVTNGPSIVFTERLPNSDNQAKVFSAMLVSLRIKHSPQYMDSIPQLRKEL